MLAKRSVTSAVVLQALAWLGQTPENFLTGQPVQPETPLPESGPGRVLRFDTKALQADLNAQRQARGAELGASRCGIARLHDVHADQPCCRTADWFPARHAANPMAWAAHSAIRSSTAAVARHVKERSTVHDLCGTGPARSLGPRGLSPLQSANEHSGFRPERPVSTHLRYLPALTTTPKADATSFVRAQRKGTGGPPPAGNRSALRE
jgi:hypothetical protein